MWGGERRATAAGRMAGEVMMEHGGGGGGGGGALVVCRADGFRIGRPPPVLAIEDRLDAGATYLLIPVDRLPHDVLTAASLAALTYDRATAAAAGGGGGGGIPLLTGAGGRSPFEYVKEEGGRTVIKVTEEFIVKAITGRRPPAASGGEGNGDAAAAALCSTPELRKHYEQLVGAARGRPAWSPRLETIKEKNRRRVVDVVVSPGRLSPVRLLGLDKGTR
uniref:Uncharacterized protein n=1 Tax=Leersia perrieri TaxID=77586 RepID=A0A0D9X2G0_9ORYZ